VQDADQDGRDGDDADRAVAAVLEAACFVRRPGAGPGDASARASGGEDNRPAAVGGEDDPYDKPGLVADQHHAQVAARYGDVAAQVIEDQARCSARSCSIPSALREHRRHCCGAGDGLLGRDVPGPVAPRPPPVRTRVVPRLPGRRGFRRSAVRPDPGSWHGRSGGGFGGRHQAICTQGTTSTASEALDGAVVFPAAPRVRILRLDGSRTRASTRPTAKITPPAVKPTV